MTLQSDLNTVTAKLNSDADQITVLGVGAGSVGTPGATVNFTLPSGHVITIDATGISSVKLSGIEIANGGFQLMDGGQYFISHAIQYPDIPTKLALVNGNTVIVTHFYTGPAGSDRPVKATVVYTFTVSGDNIFVDAKVTNTGTRIIEKPAFTSPRLVVPTNNLNAQTVNNLILSQSNIVPNPDALTYPSFNHHTAATYLKTVSTNGPAINFCLWPTGDQTKRYMTAIAQGRFGFVGWSFLCLFFDDLPIDGTLHYKFAYRFSASSASSDLLAGYKTTLRTQFPAISYSTDARPMARFTSIDKSYIRADNPYGYNDNGGQAASLWRRFDKLTGCQAFVSTIAPRFADGKMQGILCWQLQGYRPNTNWSYRPDFLIFPPETLANLPTLVNGIKALGAKIGLQGRPGVIAQTESWGIGGTEPDNIYPTGNSFGQQAKTKSLFKWGLDNGFDLGYYLDSFPGIPDEHDILKVIRATLGLVPTYCEFTTALSPAFSSIYINLSYSSGAYLYPPHYADILFLWPDVIRATVFAGNEPPGGETARLTYMFQNKLTALIPDYLVQDSTRMSLLNSLVTQYIDSNNHWI